MPCKQLPPHLFWSDSGSLHDTRLPDWSANPIRANYGRHHSKIETVADLKATLRAGQFAWPGGYEIYFIASDGGAICYACAYREFRNIADSIWRDIRDGWKVEAIDIADHCESDLNCDHCGRVIHSPESE